MHIHPIYIHEEADERKARFFCLGLLSLASIATAPLLFHHPGASPLLAGMWGAGLLKNILDAMSGEMVSINLEDMEAKGDAETANVLMALPEDQRERAFAQACNILIRQANFGHSKDPSAVEFLERMTLASRDPQKVPDDGQSRRLQTMAMVTMGILVAINNDVWKAGKWRITLDEKEMLHAEEPGKHHGPSFLKVPDNYPCAAREGEAGAYWAGTETDEGKGNRVVTCVRIHGVVPTDDEPDHPLNAKKGGDISPIHLTVLAPGGVSVRKDIPENSVNIKQVFHGMARLWSKSGGTADAQPQDLQNIDYAFVYPNHDDTMENPDADHFCAYWDYTVLNAQGSNLASEKNIGQDALIYVQNGPNLPSGYSDMYSNAAETILNFEEPHLPSDWAGR